MEEKRYSISGTARLLGVHRTTIHRWIDEGVVPKPIAEDTAGARLRYWTEEGFAKVKNHYEKHFREGQGRRTKGIKKVKKK